MNARKFHCFCLRTSSHYECENYVASHAVEVVFSKIILEFIQIGKTSCLTVKLLTEIQTYNFLYDSFCIV